MKIRHFIQGLLLLHFFAVCSCSTGIESTRRITPTRDDRRMMQPRAEERLMDSVIVAPVRDWEPGHPLMVTDNRASLIYNITDTEGRRLHADSLAGSILLFDGIESQATPGGENVGVVRFRTLAADKLIRYDTRKNLNDVSRMTWADFPMTVDMQTLRDIAERLRNRKVWTRQSLWYDEHGEPLNGAKFVPVTILDITPGNGVFALNVQFSDGSSNAWIPMNMPDGKDNKGSRMFPALFSLSDPQNAYPDILPEVWELICHGRVKEGMTKEECKLALGNPKEVQPGHNWDQLMDIWTYPDGSYLLFIDDRLTIPRK